MSPPLNSNSAADIAYADSKTNHTEQRRAAKPIEPFSSGATARPRRHGSERWSSMAGWGRVMPERARLRSAT